MTKNHQEVVFLRMEMSEAISKIMAGRLGSLIEWKSWAPSRCHTMTCITLMKWVKFVKWNYQGLLQLGDTWFSKSFFPMASKRICKAQIGLSFSPTASREYGDKLKDVDRKRKLNYLEPFTISHHIDFVLQRRQRHSQTWIFWPKWQLQNMGWIRCNK